MDVNIFEELQAHLEDNDGTATVTELATLTGESQTFVRHWAREHEVRRCGSTFVFGRDAAMEFAEDLDELDDEEDEDEDEDEEDDGE
jgi:hypothetical protein